MPVIEQRIVDIRNAIAHGRISAPEPNHYARLIKFSKPQNGEVTVEFNEIMTHQWFDINISQIHEATMRIMKIGKIPQIKPIND